MGQIQCWKNSSEAGGAVQGHCFFQRLTACCRQQQERTTGRVSREPLQRRGILLLLFLRGVAHPERCNRNNTVVSRSTDYVCWLPSTTPSLRLVRSPHCGHGFSKHKALLSKATPCPRSGRAATARLAGRLSRAART